MQSLNEKLFCPHCKLELNGRGHENEGMAWDLYNCEYDKLKDEKKPITEYEMNSIEIERLTEERAQAFQSIKKLKIRNEQIKLIKSI